MTNGEKFEEIFGLMPDEYAKDPCEMFRNFCEDRPGCDRCKLHDFWDKQYRKPKKKENEKCMTDKNVKEKHIRPDGEFYLFTKEEVEEMKEYLNSKSKVNKNYLRRNEYE